MTDDLEQAAKDMAADLDTFSEKLKGCQHDMSTIRSEASAAGLTVAGFLITDPGPGPARPPDDFVGTETEVAAHNSKVDAFDDHQDLIRAYNHASSEAERIDRQYNTACLAMQDTYTVGQHSSWILKLADIAGSGAEAAVGLSVKKLQNKLHTSAQGLVDEAKTAVKDLQAHPERYMKRKWLVFKTLDADKLAADKLVIEGKLNQADGQPATRRHPPDSRRPDACWVQSASGSASTTTTRRVSRTRRSPCRRASRPQPASAPPCWSVPVPELRSAR